MLNIQLPQATFCYSFQRRKSVSRNAKVTKDCNGEAHREKYSTHQVTSLHSSRLHTFACRIVSRSPLVDDQSSSAARIRLLVDFRRSSMVIFSRDDFFTRLRSFSSFDPLI
ncbi:hypothetical protein QYF36_014570 [Acer negundo]|nr:hypothetical protein QYF36_014570 [Acer negundo]